MHKTKIEWVKNSDGTQGYSWNPIKGLCPVGCWYCYARAIYKRFDLMDRLYGESPDRDYPLRKDTLVFDETEVMAPTKKKKPAKIFLCSTYEIFHAKVPKIFRDAIFETIEACPQHTFQILTKRPENIDRPMPDNVWLGVSVTGPQDLVRLARFNAKARVKFMSFEPMLGRAIFPLDINWIILGRLTGHGRKYDPPREWIQYMVDVTREYGVPLFLKDNLKEIWGGELVQEFPE